HEGERVVVGDTMDCGTPYATFLLALDLTRPGANVKWKFDPKTHASAQGVACCDVVNRGAVYDNGRICFNTLDNYTIALDAATGREPSRTKLGEIRLGQTMTIAP